MYAPFFGLKREPFSIAPDPRFLFMSERHREALAHLLYGLRGGGGFVLLTGEIGAGKTTVCRCFLEQIPKRCNVAYVFNPKLTVEELLRSVCEEFRIPCQPLVHETSTVKDHVDALNHFLLRTHAVGQNNVLIIDEAQNLSIDVLEQLRLLTNLETSERKLLQIILIGQPELRAMLVKPQLEQLAQRVIARYHLDALTESEAAQYVRHRLGVAGMSKTAPFDRAALRRIHQLSAGIPRRINLLCDRALLGAYARGKSQVDRRIVDRAAQEVFDVPRTARLLAVKFRSVGGLKLGLGLVGGAVLCSAVALVLDTNGQRQTSVAAGQAKALAVAPVAATATSASHAKPSLEPELRASTAQAAIRWPPLLRSEKEAWRQLASAWHVAVAEGEPCQVAPKHQLQCFRSGGSNLTLIRQLDRPAILTLYEENAAKPAYVLLTGLSDRSATLLANGVTQVVSLTALAGMWRGDFATFWRMPPGYGTRSEEKGEYVMTEWLPVQLAKHLGLSTSGNPGAISAAELKASIAAFQLAQGLHPDGRAGPVTFMQLNRVAGVDEPRLRH